MENQCAWPSPEGLHPYELPTGGQLFQIADQPQEQVAQSTGQPLAGAARRKFHRVSASRAFSSGRRPARFVVEQDVLDRPRVRKAARFPRWPQTATHHVNNVVTLLPPASQHGGAPPPVLLQIGRDIVGRRFPLIVSGRDDCCRGRPTYGKEAAWPPPSGKATSALV